MGRYIFSNYELAIAIAVVYFDYYVNLWYNKDVTKIGFFIKRRKTDAKIIQNQKGTAVIIGINSFNNWQHDVARGNTLKQEKY